MSGLIHQLHIQSNLILILYTRRPLSVNSYCRIQHNGTELIYLVFNIDEAENICQIPISRFGVQDKIIWRPTKDGKFSVRSAYHLECQRSRNQRGEPSMTNSDNSIWKSIWHLRFRMLLSISFGELVMIYYQLGRSCIRGI